jgi:hypothetical protein
MRPSCSALNKPMLLARMLYKNAADLPGIE